MERNEENLSSRGDRRDKTLTGSPAQLPVSNAMEGEQRQEPIATKSSYATTMSSKVSGNVGCEFIALRTVPVVLKNGNRKMVVNAVLDDASTTTYINSDVAAELGLQGEPQKVTVNVLNGHAETFETMPVEVGLESINGKMDVMIHAFTTEKVTGNMGVIEWEKHAKKWSHLKSIDFPKPGPRPFADVLIGIDHADLHYSYRDIRGKPGEPIARLTLLGWTCVGAPNGKQRSNFHTNFVRTHLVYDSKQNADMDSMLRKFWEIESSGTQAYAQPLKPEEQMALQKVKNSLKFNGKRYELAMPWKQDKPELPNNYSMAVRRLCGTEKRLMKNPEAGSAYSEIINTYVQKGYIRKVLTSEEAPKEKWYLPHFAVFRPDKATTKTRIVFDATAKYEGISLNDTIHQGSLQRDLFNVLLRFRRYPVALVCDIAKMYLQIEIAPEDRSYHRFLWRNLDQKLAPDEYEFNRVVFGVNSSPFQAQLVSQEHAAKHKEEFPMAAETVLESTYMDDNMDSVPNDSSGVELYKQLSGLWGKAGMHARKWLSNSEVVLKKIPSGDRALEVDLDKGNLPSLKTLGVLWLAKEDIFTFKASADAHFQFTKRNFLKKIATLFDPMGFLAPFTIRSKILLQDMWASELGWDELLDLQLTKKARKWFSELADLTEIKVPRCLQVKKRVK